MTALWILPSECLLCPPERIIIAFAAVRSPTEPSPTMFPPSKTFGKSLHLPVRPPHLLIIALRRLDVAITQEDIKSVSSPSFSLSLPSSFSTLLLSPPFLPSFLSSFIPSILPRDPQLVQSIMLEQQSENGTSCSAEALAALLHQYRVEIGDLHAKRERVVNRNFLLQSGTRPILRGSPSPPPSADASDERGTRRGKKVSQSVEASPRSGKGPKSPKKPSEDLSSSSLSRGASRPSSGSSLLFEGSNGLPPLPASALGTQSRRGSFRGADGDAADRVSSPAATTSSRGSGSLPRGVGSYSGTMPPHPSTGNARGVTANIASAMRAAGDGRQRYGLDSAAAAVGALLKERQVQNILDKS